MLTKIDFFLFDKMSSHNPERIFWENNRSWIIAVSVIVLLLIVLYFLTTIDSRRAARKKRHDSKLVNINVTDFGTIPVIYGNRYFPPIPQKSGYIFRGWFLDSACTIPWVSTTKVKKEMALYPKWEKEAG